MDDHLRTLGINPYGVEGLRAKAREWLEYARQSTGESRTECVRRARKDWRDANALARAYRRHPEFARLASGSSLEHATMPRHKAGTMNRSHQP